MGKRELVLIVAFIFLGTLLYQATAPPSPDGRGFSVRGMIDHIRREVGPRHEFLADERSQTLPIDASVSEVRITGASQLRVEGSAAAAGAIKLQVYSTGIDENEARMLGKQTRLRVDRSGDIISLELAYPREGRQRTTATISLPRRVRLRVARATRFEARNIAGVEFDNTRGQAKLTSIAGTVRGTFAGGELTLEGIRDVDLTARRSEITLSSVDGDVRLDLSGGSLTARNIKGNLELDANRVGIELDRIAGRVDADLTQGSFELTRPARDVRVDARGTEVRIELEQPVAVTAITTDENISVRLPDKGGFTFDVTVDHGEIRLPEMAEAPLVSEQTSRATGVLRGGGPTLALRTTRADVVVR